MGACVCLFDWIQLGGVPLRAVGCRLFDYLAGWNVVPTSGQHAVRLDLTRMSSKMHHRKLREVSYERESLPIDRYLDRQTW